MGRRWCGPGFHPHPSLPPSRGKASERIRSFILPRGRVGPRAAESGGRKGERSFGFAQDDTGSRDRAARLGRGGMTWGGP